MKGELIMRAMHSVIITAAAIALLTFSIPVTAFSQMKERPYRQGHGQMMGIDNIDRMGDMMGMCIEHADRLGLSDDQVAKMKPAHREMQKKHAQFKADLKIAEIELMEIMEVKDFDLEKGTATVKKIADIKTAHRLEMLTHMKEMRTMLTDDQFRNMKKLMPLKGENRPARKMLKKR
jgi:Spy/CpxP family protein refolding chaperone